MAEKRPLDERFDRSIDSWTHSMSFMNASTSRDLVSSRLKRPVVQPIRSRIDETADEWYSRAKAEGFLLHEVGNS